MIWAGNDLRSGYLLVGIKACKLIDISSERAWN